MNLVLRLEFLNEFTEGEDSWKFGLLDRCGWGGGLVVGEDWGWVSTLMGLSGVGNMLFFCLVFEEFR